MPQVHATRWRLGDQLLVARSAPGMPLKVEERTNGEVVYSSTAIENIPGTPTIDVTVS